MVWFLVDDNLAFHKKVLAAGDAAMGMWVRAGSWSAANLTDGYIPEQVRHQIGDKRLANSLVTSELWSRVTNPVTGRPIGYQFHDWHHCQPPSDQVKQRREQARVRKQRQRAKTPLSPEKNRHVTPDVTRDSHARARPSPLKDLGSLPHQGPAPPARPAPPSQATTPAAWLTEIADCQLCDDEGMRKPNRQFACDHIDRTQTVQNGMAKVRAALAKKTEGDDPF